MHICANQYRKKKKKNSKILGYSSENITILYDKTKANKNCKFCRNLEKIFLHCYYIYFKSTPKILNNAKLYVITLKF